MKQHALGLIETVGYTAAVSAADAALKAANVTLTGVERVIGAGGALGVTIHLSGDVAAVTSAVQAGREAAEKVGKVISSHVIPRAHNEVNDKIISRFLLEGSKETNQKEGNQATEKKRNAGKKKIKEDKQDDLGQRDQA